MLADGKSVADAQTGVLAVAALQAGQESKPPSSSPAATTRKTLYVALVDAESSEALIKAGGSRDPHMRRIVWDVSKWIGREVRFEVVDRATTGWGHLNVDDFSVQNRGGGAGKARSGD